MLQIIGAGLGRTGTHSLAQALDQLGFGPCYTLLEVSRNPHHALIWQEAVAGQHPDWRVLFAGYRSAVEWPTVAFLPQILKAFPDALVILTVRNPEAWYRSAARTIFPGLAATAHHPDPAKRKQSEWKRRLILDQTFHSQWEDKQKAVGVYQQHIERVKAMVPEERFLQYQVSDGWEPLCRFLDIAPPGDSFPHRNRLADFLASAPPWAKSLMENEDDNDE